MNQLSDRTNIILCGFTGCGKTTIGKPLARRLGYDFVDTDHLLTATCQMTIPEIFARGGEGYFRDLEHEIAQTAAAFTHTVISTGGGMMTFERNASVLAQTGTVIYLNLDFETCYRRLANQPDRPLVRRHTKEELRQLYDSRTEYYKKYASFTLENPGRVKEAVETIIQFLNSSL